MTRSQFLYSALPLLSHGRAMAAPQRPNIVYIYADDCGYGDLSCYGATRVKTPNLDRLAASGVRFTNAHSPSATCTPSRYALLTGEYAWRRKGTGILPGDASTIIEPGRYTLPAMLKKSGYSTGAVGKWHLGLGKGNLDWNGEIKPGPQDIGFDYSFLIPATGDRVPCVYVENRRVVGLDPRDPIVVNYEKPIGNDPTGKAHPELLKMHPSHGHDMTIVNGVSRIGYMSGGKAARWVDEDIADTITGKALGFIERQKANPFFLYFATHDIHVPRVPNKRFVGKTPMGPRGDAIVELDWSVGQVLDALDRHKLTDNTMVIFTSDNGPVVDDGYQDQAVEKLGSHKPAGPWRGGKYSAYDGGTRVPFLLKWPGKVKPQVSEAMVCQVDLLSSFASLTGQKLPSEAGPDSLDVLPALLGQSKKGRDSLVEHAGALSLVVGDWKVIEAHPGPKTNETRNELGNDASPQLFHISEDPGEQTNVAAQNPGKVKEMLEMLNKVKAAGRSRM
ncbi:arylsulfatase [uncultured Paludibaculum sp.]|uniref:sulfatase family protein n=1 Tax=uncultured Paludibaculum sp. TaxID=1765020 RepID=UPI00374DB429